MKAYAFRIAKILALALVCAGLASCEDPQVYGSVGVSSYGGGGYYGGRYGGGPRVGGSISVGGRIY
jgi:uncharacterized membrane protein